MEDLRKKTVEERNKLLLEKREELRLSRLHLSGSKTRNTKEGKNLRKEIARILTVLNEGPKA